ncbi:MAG: carboxylating nicotinate-nucleotide diphosphorylase [Oscillospiraceae bacterium]|jgi:nicotinate-nucleotide pyrophosphorylase (carboxylating)|nr:carboxylating nicotinate-nucleotide diphosphorylase [Oscillospiraceae bacterium]
MALKEDIGTGDITTLSCVDEDAVSEARLIAKEDGILCGIEIFRHVYALIDARVAVDAVLKDGDAMAKGDLIATVNGPSRAMLSGERVALNLLQHLSGIATKTGEYADILRVSKAHIVDTRKTTPGMRGLEKYAVRVGGGHNHRFSLADAVLIKDNHIKAAGGIASAVLRARNAAPFTMKIEVECETILQVREALAAKADIIMLDNMSNEQMKAAVQEINGRAIVEASGNMGDKDAAGIAAAADTGVDVISIGALTHSVKALDISLKFS